MRKRMEKEVLYDYREWLVSFVDTPDQAFHEYYSCLMDQLFHTPYRWKIKRDQDRYLDGLALRKDFGLYDYDAECSVLECLVALFRKYSDTVWTDVGDDSVAPELFYDALEHLNLLYFDDSRYNSEAVSDVLERFLDCKFSLFPVTFSKKSEGLWGVVGKFSMEKW